MRARACGLVAVTLILLLVPGVSVPAASQSLAGKLLVAAPSMRDPNFARTVVYMVQHDEGGAMGLVINRVVGEGPLADLLRSLDLPTKGVSGNIRIHYGGPVGIRQGFILHSADYRIDGSIVVNRDFSLTSDPEVLGDIGRGHGPDKALFAFGYAGWGPGQLEGELMQDAWVTVSADPVFVFEGEIDKKWEQAIAREELEL